MTSALIFFLFFSKGYGSKYYILNMPYILIRMNIQAENIQSVYDDGILVQVGNEGGHTRSIAAMFPEQWSLTTSFPMCCVSSHVRQTRKSQWCSWNQAHRLPCFSLAHPHHSIPTTSSQSIPEAYAFFTMKLFHCPGCLWVSGKHQWCWLTLLLEQALNNTLMLSLGWPLLFPQSHS